MPRFLSSLLLALALLLSPLAMIGAAGAAHAATPQAAPAAGHCAEKGPTREHDKRAPGMEAGCAVACAAVPATEAFTADRLPHDPMAPALLGDQLLSGIHPEGETPPPRVHPEI
jgi:putative hemolysin